MESSASIKVSIKNRTCYYFYYMIEIEDFDLDNNLLDEKSYENIFIYDFLYKILIDAKALHIRFDKIDGFVRVYNGTRYLVLFSSENYDPIYNRIRYLITEKKWYYIYFFLLLHKYESWSILLFACRKNVDLA